MNVEIGTEAAQFLSWEYLNGICVAVEDAHLLSSAGPTTPSASMGNFL